MSIQEHDVTATLHELGEDFNLTQEEVDAFVQAEFASASSALRSTDLMRGTTAAAELRGKVTRIPATFAGKLPGSKQVLIRKLYPDFDVVFKQDQVQPHAVAACVRMLDRALLKKRAPAGQTLLSVGGNYEYELTHSEVPVHSCTPDHRLVNDPKEAARDVQRKARLRAMAKGIGCSGAVAERAAGYFRDERPWRCRKLAQECDYPAGVIMMAHVYDMTLEQIVQAMVSHGAKLVLGCVLFSNDMLTADSGKLSDVDGYFGIQGGKISFGFEGESQWEYSHNWAEFRRYGFGGAVVEYKGRQAFYSVTEQRGNTLFFSMTLAPVVVKPVVLTKSWRVDEKKRAVVKGYRMSESDRTSERRALVPAVFSYPYDPFVKSLSYAIERMEKGSFSLEDLQRKVRAVFADTTINSVRVTGFTRLEDDEMAYFLSNVGVLAALSVHKASSDERMLLESVKTSRAAMTQTLVEKVRSALTKLIVQPFPNESVVCERWRSFVRAIYSAEDAIVSGIAWETDMGYRYAKSAPAISSAGDITVSAGAFDSDEMSRDELQALLMSAAVDSPEFALVMAEVAGKISPHPVIEQWATDLRAKYKVAVDERSREAERNMLMRMEDPDVMFLEGSITAADACPVADRALAIDGESQELVDSMAPAIAAADMGITLDPNDEVELFHHSLAEVEAVANAAIREAIYLIEVEQEKLLGECRKNFEQVTINGLPETHKLAVHGNLNYDPEFWNVTDGIIPLSGFSGPDRLITQRHFPYAAVYIREVDAIVRVTAVLLDKEAGTYAHRVELENGLAYTGLVMATKKLVIYNGPVVVSNMRTALNVSLAADFSLSFIEGVPGCGKTHYIIHNVPHDGAIIACGRENAEDTRQRVIDHTKDAAGVTQFKQPTRGVRTLDSALMFPTKDRKGTMFLDECFQDHAGKFWAVIKLWGAQKVQALGDRCQIPYIDRNYTNKCQLPRLSHWSVRVGKYLTRRCPRDATMAVAGFYERKIRTTSQVSGSLKLSLDTVDVPNLPEYKYLTMYQDDKHTLIRKGFVEVNTVAEVQGQTYEHVALVRIQEREMPLFNDDAQVDVALTRHTKSFIYYAPDARRDKVQRLVEETKNNLSLVDKYGEVSTAGVDIFDV